MKYDDASWHYGGNFPSDLPDSAGATHTGIFLAWAVLVGLGGELFTVEEPELVNELCNRTTTPGSFFLKVCDGKLTDEDLSDRGNKFAVAYYEDGQYLADYEEMLGSSLASPYHVPDVWASFDTLRPRLDERLARWSASEG
ncbi:hypothetical protein IAE60_00940 [Pseudoxanthomonas mexicana]|uniref:DUF7832 domain-containing protein n=1 Tax=Pseudoxanthomonas mexicana TaxID=128785 RepID=A0A7G9TD69_PSEMX|nr:hypothetical protein [Pseudoxanthomonas mexicana]QNN78044.1 hypothetical protein IAE60_00940 [Pseudoxanthomonas mexicana]